MFISEIHNVFTEKVNKIAFSVNDDKRIKTPDGVISCLYSVGPGIVRKEELMRHPKMKKVNIIIN